MIDCIALFLALPSLVLQIERLQEAAADRERRVADLEERTAEAGRRADALEKELKTQKSCPPEDH